ncbi:hypothetical protein [Rheinheimera sp. EpRS3]|uniref:hypothetical protein n=1 Tax=Rheinheimera sp. EpRS3 TaxID=1712383 RepID=UPI000745F32E|nr:hypothetical protein [Rheinheimera sp. EpRS3]KUM53569.1 hypothetical protein AR688_06595 [Rheinheimera sp. EpRS3]
MNIDFTEQELPEGWCLLDSNQSMKMSLELGRETCETHKLHGLNSKALARKDGRDDFLFKIEGAPRPLYVVHLTWSKETSPDWPWITEFGSKTDFIENWRKIYD